MTVEDEVPAVEVVNLHISYGKRIGWSITEPTEGLIDFIISQGWDDIRMNRNEGFTAIGIGSKGGNATGTDIEKPKKGNSRKMVCSCCGLTVRATRDNLKLLCMDCEEQLIYVRNAPPSLAGHKIAPHRVR